MARQRDITRDSKQAPSYAHWHAWCRFPSGLRSEGIYWTRKEAIDDNKAMRTMARDGFPRWAGWCTNSTQIMVSGSCHVHGERPVQEE